MINILIWFSFILLNIGWGFLTSEVVNEQKKNATYKSIKHGWWGLAYCLLMSVAVVFVHNVALILLLISIALLHLSIFPVVYNSCQNLPTFNLSKTSRALTDRLMVKLGLKDTAAVNIVALLISIALLILSIYK